MASELGLSGLTKEVFAVIFCFWIAAGEKSVKASFSVIQTITGAARATVMNSIAGLIDRNYISAEKRNGKATLYMVTIDQKIIDNFKKVFRHKTGSIDRPAGVQLLNRTGSMSELQNKRKQVYKGTGTSLKVKPCEKMDFGGLPEVK